MNELQTRDEPWLVLAKYKMSIAAKTWPFPRADAAAWELAGYGYPVRVTDVVMAREGENSWRGWPPLPQM